MEDWLPYVEGLGKSARRAGENLAVLNGAARSAALRRIAALIRERRDVLLKANALDVEAAQKSDLQPALVERLKLNDKRVAAMAEGVEQIAAQVDPVGQTIEGYVPPNGLRIQKMAGPWGAVRSSSAR